MSVEDIVYVIFCVEIIFYSLISFVIYFIVVEVSIEEKEDISICNARMVIEVERRFVEGTISPTFDVEEVGEEVD